MPRPFNALMSAIVFVTLAAGCAETTGSVGPDTLVTRSNMTLSSTVDLTTMTGCYR